MIESGELTLAEKLAQARAELDEQESGIEASLAVARQERELRILVAKKANNEIFAQLQASQHTELARIEYDDGEGMVVVRRPPHTEYRNFQNQDKLDSVVCERFVVPFVVHPGKKEFLSLITTECKCDLLVKATNACLKLAEGNARVIAKK